MLLKYPGHIVNTFCEIVTESNQILKWTSLPVELADNEAESLSAFAVSLPSKLSQDLYKLLLVDIAIFSMRFLDENIDMDESQRQSYLDEFTCIIERTNYSADEVRANAFFASGIARP